MRLLMILLICSISCAKQNGRETEACVDVACGGENTFESKDANGIHKILLDQPHQMNEYALHLQWPSVEGSTGYRITRTFSRGGRTHQAPLITDVSENNLTDKDLVGGSLVVYRIESLTANETTVPVGETQVSVPLDVQFEGGVTSQKISELSKTYSLNRIVFQKGVSVSLEDHALNLDAQSITFYGTSFITFSSVENAHIAATPGGLGLSGAPGIPGRSGGSVRIRAKSIRGTASFVLSGQNGGQGGTGSVGVPGNDGGGGDISCVQRRGTDGQRGGNGGPGGQGGATSQFYLEANEATDFTYSIQGTPGTGGTRGNPGGGGFRGVGKTVYCGIGFLGAPLAGYAGNNGPNGDFGTPGAMGVLSPQCLILGKKIVENVQGSCNRVHGQ